MSRVLSWSDRFALIDHFTPPDAAVCAAFNVSQAELNTARQLRAQGTFRATANLDVTKYDNVFSGAYSAGPIPVVTARPNTTVHTRPESATCPAKVPQKRGRKGNKITTALQAVPTTPMVVEDFVKQHGVSVAVLRQAKRFIQNMEPADATSIGTVHVRQDKSTKQLMIWRTTQEAPQ